MSDYRYDPELLEVGDTFEGGPIEMGYFISSILSIGGTVSISGETATVTGLPGKKEDKSLEPAALVEEVPAEVEAIVAATVAAIEAEALSPAEDLAAIEEVVVEEVPVPEVAPEPKPIPKPRGRKPKAAPVSTVEE